MVSDFNDFISLGSFITLIVIMISLITGIYLLIRKKIEAFLFYSKMNHSKKICKITKSKNGYLRNK